MDARIDTHILNGGRGLALRRPPPRSTLRRALGIADEGQQLEALSEGLGEGSLVITHDGEPAASRWGVRREGTDDQLPAGGQRAAEHLHVFSAVPRVGQEVKDGPVMPEIELLGCREPGDVRFDPWLEGL